MCSDFFINATITSTGAFTFHVKEGGGGFQNTCSGGTVQNSFSNSPMTITIVPGATSSTETVAIIPTTVADGETLLIITLEPRDDYGNPKTLQSAEAGGEGGGSEESDVFEFFWDYDEDARTAITNTTSEISKTTEGTSLLHIELNGLAIRGSPFAVTTEKLLSQMPGRANVALIVGSLIGGETIQYTIEGGVQEECRRNKHYTNIR